MRRALKSRLLDDVLAVSVRARTDLLSCHRVRLQPADLRGQRSGGHRGRHRVRYRRQGRSLVQCRRVERREVRRDRQVAGRHQTAGSRPRASCLRDVEPGTPVNIEPAMRAFAERNTTSSSGSDSRRRRFSKRSRRTTRTSSLRSSTASASCPNVASLVFKEHEGLVPGRHPRRDDDKDGHAWISRRHGHRAHPPVRARASKRARNR